VELGAFSQAFESLTFELAESPLILWMLVLQRSSCCLAVGGLLAPLGVLLVVDGVEALGALLVVDGVEALGVLVVVDGVEALGVLVAVDGVEAVVVLDAVLLPLPHPATSAPQRSGRTRRVDSFRIKMISFFAGRSLAGSQLPAAILSIALMRPPHTPHQGPRGRSAPERNEDRLCEKTGERHTCLLGHGLHADDPRAPNTPDGERRDHPYWS
jgi:hypothetical protein